VSINIHNDKSSLTDDYRVHAR